jgi:hypothetical protein
MKDIPRLGEAKVVREDGTVDEYETFRVWQRAIGVQLEEERRASRWAAWMIVAVVVLFGLTLVVVMMT